jgi:hypothetical protein
MLRIPLQSLTWSTVGHESGCLEHTRALPAGSAEEVFARKLHVSNSRDVAQRWDQLSCRDANEVAH